MSVLHFLEGHPLIQIYTCQSAHAAGFLGNGFLCIRDVVDAPAFVYFLFFVVLSQLQLLDKLASVDGVLVFI
jgi:hypothetical protein